MTDIEKLKADLEMIRANKNASSQTPTAPKPAVNSSGDIQKDLANLRANAGKVATAPQTEDQKKLQQLQQVKQANQQKRDSYFGGRDNLFEKGLGALHDFGTGAGNAFIKGAQNLYSLTGISNNPQFQRGTESNKFMNEGLYEEEGFFGKAGQLGAEAAQFAAPTGWIKRATMAAPIISKLANTNKFGRAAQTALGLGVEGAASGAALDVINTGEANLGSSAAYGGLNILGGGLVNLITRTKGLKEINKAITAGDFDKAKEIFEGPEMFSIRRKLGIDTPEGIEAAKQKDIALINDGIKMSKGTPTKQLELIESISDDSKRVAAQHMVANYNPKGKKDLTSAIQNIRKDQQDTYRQIQEITDVAMGNGLLPKQIYEIGLNSDMDTIMRQKINDLDLDVTSKANLEKEIDKLRKSYPSNSIDFAEADRIKRKSNEERSNDRSQWSTDKMNAYDIFADSFRALVKIDAQDELHKLERSGFDNPTALARKEVLEKYIELSKQYGMLKDAQRVIDLVGPTGSEGSKRFEEMIGGIIATGGTYNPIGYAVGSKASQMLMEQMKIWKDRGLYLTSKTNPVKMSENSAIIQKNVDVANEKRSKAPTIDFDILKRRRDKELSEGTITREQYDAFMETLKNPPKK